MATERQIAANRRNAKHSTGPRSECGKAVSAQNALLHGLRAQCGLLPGEDEAEYEALRDRVRAGLAPDGALEELLAERVVACAWRLRRAARVEAAVLSFLGRADPDPTEGSSAHGWHGGTLDAADRTALAYLRLANCAGLSANMLRYEGSLERGLYRALAELERLQHATRAE